MSAPTSANPASVAERYGVCMNSRTRYSALAVFLVVLAACAKSKEPSPHPTMKIDVAFPDASPQVVQDAICAPAELMIIGVDGLEKITCVSDSGHAEIYVEGQANVDPAAFANRIDKRLQLVKPVLPATAKLGKVTDISGEAIPLPKVREIEYSTVDIDRTKAASLSVSLNTVFDALRANGNGKPLDNLTVESEGGAKIKVRDIATIKTARGPDHLVLRYPREGTTKPSDDRSSEK
jgi:multidrug efflux pump subunit AcrB